MLGFDQTITIYNAVHNPETGYDEYHKTVITGCSWQSGHITGHNGTSFQRENVHKIRIPANVHCSKVYVHPHEYTDPAAQYTLQNGVRIVRGVGEDIERLNDLDGKYADICNVTAVHDNRRIGLKHIYVEGK